MTLPSPDAADPSRFPRRVLLAVAGLSPQVVTETVFALAVRRQPPFVPTEVRLLTTREGAERARLTLLSRDPGWFARLRRDYRLPPIAFSKGSIQVFSGADGALLDDIRTPGENERVADQLAAALRVLAADAAAALHVSIAGGRKTMGFYAGYALSLFGRPQDRLSHVLVSPPYESSPQFFYPTPRSRIIHTAGPDSRPLDTRAAQVTLAEIPFVRLREGLPPALLRGQASFSETVAAMNAALAPPLLQLEPARRRVRCGAASFLLPAADFALLAWFARRALARRGAVIRSEIGRAETAEFLAEYQRAAAGADHLGRVARALRDGMDAEDFDQRRARLHARLCRALGPAAAAYTLAATGRRPNTAYHLPLPPERIQLAPPAPGRARESAHA